MTKVELFHELFSIHPENVQEELERLPPLIKEYEKMRDNDLARFRRRIEDIEALKVRIANLKLFAKALKENDR